MVRVSVEGARGASKFVPVERPPFGHRYEPADLPHPFSEKAGRAVTRWALRGYLGAEHVDRQHIPKRGAAILVGNHPSFVDPFLVAFGTKRWVSWLAFEEALQWPGAGQIMRLYRVIPLNTDKPQASSIKAAYATLARGRLLGVFCEGERSHGFDLNDPIKTGAARMAMRANVPVVPVTIAGARKAWPMGGYPKPGKVVVRYHPPLHPDDFDRSLTRRQRADQMTNAIANSIKQALPPGGAPRFFRSKR